MSQARELPKAKDLARGKWPGLLEKFGISPKALDGRNHPCPKNGEGEDRFRFTDRDGTGSYFCHCDDRARAGAANGLSLLMCCRNWTYQQACEEVEKVVGTVKAGGGCRQTDEERDKRRRERMREIAATCGPCRDAVKTYLAGRGLEPTEAIKQGVAKYWDTSGDRPSLVGEFDVMVVPIKSPAGKSQALHVTFIADGKKAPVDKARRVIGSSDPGSAIRLFPEAEEMGVGEGVETSLAAASIYNVPVWATYSAGRLEEFEPPACVKVLWIFADNDESGTGQIAAYRLMQRMHAKGVEANVLMPRRKGTDFNDMLNEVKEAA